MPKMRKTSIENQIKGVEKILGSPTVVKVSCYKGKLTILGLSTYNNFDDEDYPESAGFDVSNSVQKITNYIC